VVRCRQKIPPAGCIERQGALLARRRTAGAYTAEAEELLVVLEESLTLARQHRLLIVREIDRQARLQAP
jgi:hypothetical protein